MTVKQVAGWLMLLFIRGLALWVIWPIALIVWLLRLPYAVVRRRPISLGKLAGWLDINFVALLQASALRPLFDTRLPFEPWRRAQEAERPRLIDLV